VKSNHIKLSTVIKEKEHTIADHEKTIADQGKKLKESQLEILKLNEILVQKENELKNTLTNKENEIQEQKKLLEQSEVKKNNLYSKWKDMEIKQAYVLKLEKQVKAKNDELILLKENLKLEKQVKAKNDELALLKEKQIKKLKESSPYVKQSSPRDNNSGVYFDEKEDMVVINGKKYPYPIFDQCYIELNEFSKKNNGKLPKFLMDQLDCYKAIYSYMEAERQINQNFDDQNKNERNNDLDQIYSLPPTSKEKNRLQDMANKLTPKDDPEEQYEFSEPKNSSFHNKMEAADKYFEFFPEESEVMVAKFGKTFFGTFPDPQEFEKVLKDETNEKKSEQKLQNPSKNEKYEKNFEQLHFEIDETKDILELFKKRKTQILEKNPETKIEFPVNFSHLETDTEKQKPNTSNAHKNISTDSFATLFVEAELNSMGVDFGKKCKSTKKNKKKNRQSQQEELLEKQLLTTKLIKI